MSALTDLTFSTSHDLFSAVSNRTKTCAVCKETKTEKYWYKDLQDSTAFRCHACYQKARGKITKTCAVCKETKTKGRWYKDPQDSTAFRCDSCYQKARGEITKTCSVCKKIKTKRRWYKDPQDSTAFRCLSCYKKACYDNRNKRGLDEQPLSEKKRKTMTLSLSPEEEEATVPRGLSLPLSPGLLEFTPSKSDDPFGDLDDLL